MSLIAATAGGIAPAAGGRLADRIVGFARAHPLALVVSLALAIRLALLAIPLSYFPDEIFQYLEPAHRLAFGPAVVPWEYRYGIRSWLLPLLLAGPMAVGGWAAPAGGAYLLFAKLTLVLTSLGTVLAAWMIGGRLSPRHALFSALLVAIWSETALFATQALTEAVAVTPILLGAAMLEGRQDAPRRIVAAGALLALGVVLRFQYGPAVAVLAVVACRGDIRRWTFTAIGGAAVLIASGAIDVAAGGRPFGWIFENFHQNIGLQRSHAWTDGPTFYVLMIAVAFGAALLPAWGCARMVAARYPALVACAVTNVAVHTLIAHKEYRYVLLSTTILVVLAGIGTVDAIDAARRRWPERRNAWLPVAIVGWATLSVGAYASGQGARVWTRVTPGLEAFAALRETPGLCGVAVVGDYWADTGGYAYLHRDVPIYVPDDSDAAPATWVPAARGGFDAIMAPARLSTTLPDDYARTACFGDGRACLFRRPGKCDARAAASHEINRVLVRTDR